MAHRLFGLRCRVGGIPATAVAYRNSGAGLRNRTVQTLVTRKPFSDTQGESSGSATNLELLELPGRARNRRFLKRPSGETRLLSRNDSSGSLRHTGNSLLIFENRTPASERMAGWVKENRQKKSCGHNEDEFRRIAPIVATTTGINPRNKKESQAPATWAAPKD